VVPEANGPGMAVIGRLRELGVPIYQRMKPDSTNPAKMLPGLGWDTNNMTRDFWVNALADANREQERGLNCCYKPAVKEFRTFVINDREKAEAAPGKHDDWVAGIGIGLCCIKFAGTYLPRSSFQTPTQSGHEKRDLAFAF